jgi:DNA-binding transcriptional LysR family regulator
MNDRIRELDIFLRVTEESSFSAAARALDCNPSTISKLIQRLEDRLGVRLFHRTSRALALTPEGERFLEGAQKVIDALEDAENVIGQSKIEASGVLRINSALTFAQSRLVPLMPEFLARNPQLRIEFVLTASPLDLFEHQIDVSLQVGHVPDSSLVAKRLATTRWVICAAPSYLKKRGIPQTLDDLSQHNCLNFLPGSYLSQWTVRKGAATVNLDVKGNIGANSGEILRSLVSTGLGIARLSEFNVGAEIAAGRLVRLLPDFEMDLGEPVFAIYASKRNISHRLKVFLDFLDEKFRS